MAASHLSKKIRKKQSSNTLGQMGQKKSLSENNLW